LNEKAARLMYVLFCDPNPAHTSPDSRLLLEIGFATVGRGLGITMEERIGLRLRKMIHEKKKGTRRVEH